MIPVRKVSKLNIKKIIKFELNYSMERGLKNTIEWDKKNANDSK